MQITLTTQEKETLARELETLMAKIDLLYERYTLMAADHVHYHDKIERLRRISKE